jgi:hypothetical protein
MPRVLYKKKFFKMAESKNAQDNYKREKREVLTSAVVSLLNDLGADQRAKILEGDTPEEVVDYCKRIYDSEFDLNVEPLGIAGANEIAWEEALGIFNDTGTE